MNCKYFFLIAIFVTIFSSCTNYGADEIKELKLKNETLKLELLALQEEQKVLEANKKLIVDFFNEVFNELNIDAIDKYIGDVYIQHDPAIADGKKALKEEVEKWFKHMKPNSVEVRRIIAEKDLVFVHTKNSSGSQDISLMHVFRIEDKLIVEHWITLQPVPEVSENSNTMF